MSWLVVRAVRARQSVCLLLASLVLSSCADITPRQRVTRALVVTGALVAVAGGAVLAGCVPDNAPGACSAQGRPVTISVGLPLVAVGAAIITTALLARAPAQRPSGPPTMRHAAPSFGDPFGPAPNQGY